MKTAFQLSGLAAHLVNDNLLDKTAALHALQNSNAQEMSFVTYLVNNKILTSDAITKSCEKFFGLPTFDLQNYNKIWLEHSPLSMEFIRRYRTIPLEKHDTLLHVGIADPTDQHALDAIVFHTGLRVTPLIISEEQISIFINSFCSEQDANKHLQLNLLRQITLEDYPDTIRENITSYDGPLVQFVDNIILDAYQRAASDIHIEPYETICRIRFRQHGILYPANEIPNPLASRLATRLKVMANLDIAERRLPQDGRFQLHGIDIRINTCPTLSGEKIVLRLLNMSTVPMDIGNLGLTPMQHDLFLKKITQPQGMVLVTGPTGCGKTVTLYSALNHLNKPEKNISTVEDPIEIRLTGINQVNVNTKIGLTFSTVLRTLLRQDPDIIMVGEIRDTETADIAIKAAQTGHLLLSTLHTNSAAETILRLQSMGVFSYNLASSISLIIAQRLVRTLCVNCRQPEVAPEYLLNYSGFDSQKTIYRAAGCSHCFHGYINRTAIYEFLPVTETIAKLIVSDTSTLVLIQHAKEEGFLTLRDAGFKKVLEGTTSLAEINRILQS